MKGIQTVNSVVAVMPETNIDTDQILPKQFLTSIDKKGFGKHLFHDQRYLDQHEQVPNPDFVLNKPPFNRAKIILAGDNFGCGSSREHAPWALKDFGIDIIISTRFADIFFNNCINNRIVPVVVSESVHEALMQQLTVLPTLNITVDVERCLITTPTLSASFSLNPHQHKALTLGLDEIDQTLLFEHEISRYEAHISR